MTFLSNLHSPTEIVFITISFIILLPCVLFFFEYQYRESHFTFNELKSILDDPSSDSPLFYLNSTLISLPSPPLSDGYYFGLVFPKAIRYRRVTEYCQWTEYYTDHKIGDDDDDATPTYRREYYYQLGWHSRQIPSILFDQPIVHSNPNRDPVPSYQFSIDSLNLSNYQIGFDFISKLNHYVHFIPDQKTIATFDQNQYMNRDNFRYVGNGYFYSSYSPSSFEQIATLVGLFVETPGSNPPLTEFFSRCRAGDIRVHFEIVQPRSLSLIGKKESNTIVPFTTSKGFKTAIIYEGIKDYESMLFDEYLQLPWYFYLLYTISFLWSFVAFRLCTKDYFYGVIYDLIATVAGACFLITLIWIILWPSLFFQYFGYFLASCLTLIFVFVLFPKHNKRD